MVGEGVRKVVRALGAPLHSDEPSIWEIGGAIGDMAHICIAEAQDVGSLSGSSGSGVVCKLERGDEVTAV